MTCSEVSSLVARCPDCEHLCSSRYSEECQYENYIDYCGCCEFCTGSANSVDKRGGLFQHKHNTRRVLRTDSTRRILRTDNTMRVLGTDNTRRVLRTDNNVKRIVCSPSYCESFTCEPIKECDGVIKKNGGFCECCDICMIQLGFVGGPTINCDSDGTFAPTQCEGAFLGSEYVNIQIRRRQSGNNGYRQVKPGTRCNDIHYKDILLYEDNSSKKLSKKAVQIADSSHAMFDQPRRSTAKRKSAIVNPYDGFAHGAQGIRQYHKRACYDI
ncbi:unnamed protein product [Mytilus edulis]|uniref:IGFBP N-terminal domain-containing protein n=1 Tax=Mytilus edulis TaxID=6550 RepID=A0A8S3QNI6_MYTED|nr:unnamed protein product [Mytilus edulis]